MLLLASSRWNSSSLMRSLRCFVRPNMSFFFKTVAEGPVVFQVGKMGVIL